MEIDWLQLQVHFPVSHGMWSLEQCSATQGFKEVWVFPIASQYSHLGLVCTGTAHAIPSVSHPKVGFFQLHNFWSAAVGASFSLGIDSGVNTPAPFCRRQSVARTFRPTEWRRLFFPVWTLQRHSVGRQNGADWISWSWGFGADSSRSRCGHSRRHSVGSTLAPTLVWPAL